MIEAVFGERWAEPGGGVLENGPRCRPTCAHWHRRSNVDAPPCPCETARRREDRVNTSEEDVGKRLWPQALTKGGEYRGTSGALPWAWTLTLRRPEPREKLGEASSYQGLKQHWW